MCGFGILWDHDTTPSRPLMTKYSRNELSLFICFTCHEASFWIREMHQHLHSDRREKLSSLFQKRAIPSFTVYIEYSIPLMNNVVTLPLLVNLSGR